MQPEILIGIDQEIQSTRTGKILKCYNVLTVISTSNPYIVHSYEYNFWDATKKRAKTINQPILKQMLNGVWNIINS